MEGRGERVCSTSAVVECPPTASLLRARRQPPARQAQAL